MMHFFYDIGVSSVRGACGAPDRLSHKKTLFLEILDIIYKEVSNGQDGACSNSELFTPRVTYRGNRQQKTLF